MALVVRRYAIIAALLLGSWYILTQLSTIRQLPSRLNTGLGSDNAYQSESGSSSGAAVDWSKLQQHYPIKSFLKLPTSAKADIPQIQHRFTGEAVGAKKIRQERQAAIKEAFIHTWNGYKEYAWLKDEVAPLSGGSRNVFGGWGATLVDSLDTLWIMGLTSDFEEAVKAVETIDFSSSTEETLNVFETTIRYLGGFLGAYDISGKRYPSLLRKAVEIGEMLYVAFDTPNRMPVTRWKWQEALSNKRQEAGSFTLLAEIGSLTLEFTRLSQLTHDPKYFDAVQRITNALEVDQLSTKVPGLWPVLVNAQQKVFNADTGFTLGGMADSTYEYLPKQHLLLQGRTPQYQSLYAHALAAFRSTLFWQPMTPSPNPHQRPLLIPGGGSFNPSTGAIDRDFQFQHLGCFAGGMLALAAKAFASPAQDLHTARSLLDGCLWAYNATSIGIAPEIFTGAPCPSTSELCPWDEDKYLFAVAEAGADSAQEGEPPYARARRLIERQNLPEGFAAVPDGRYILRPETIESVFVLYRITGDEELLEAGWRMWESISKVTRTDVAFAALDNVMVAEGEAPPKADRMESFWTAETLKYFYLLFSEPSLVSLDEYVLNTEAHPFKLGD